MELCVLAKIVILLWIIIISFDICAFGVSVFSILFDILFAVFVVFITNLYCDFWIAKGIVVFSLFFAVTGIAACFAKDEIHKMLQEEELNRQQQEQQKK